MTRKLSEKSKTKKLDKLWSEYIKKRANGRCEMCGSTDYVNAHHIFGRRNFSVRWDVENGILLCAKHHTFDRFSAHQAPTWFSDWLVEYKSWEWYEELLKKAKTVCKPDKDELIEYLTELLERK